MYFAWGTNGWDNQTWELDVLSGATRYLFSNEWAVVTGFLPGSNETKLLSSGSQGKIWIYDIASATYSVWQDNDQLASRFGFNAFRYELGFSETGLAVVRAGWASAGGEAVFLADVCSADATHHLCNLTVLSNPGGGGGGWDRIAAISGIDRAGRYAFYRTSINGDHKLWRRDLTTGEQRLLWNGGAVSLNVTRSEVLFNAPIPSGVGRAVFACDIESLVCRTVLSGDNTLESFVVVETVDSTPPVVAPEVTGSEGLDHWYVGDVTVQWHVSDPESPVTPVGCDTQTVTSDTTGVTITCSATSAGGTTTESVTIKRDATKPTMSSSRVPAANLSGWNNTDVTVAFTCEDAMSGVVSCTGNTVVGAEGAGQLVTGTAMDAAGNVASLDVSPINIDKTAPGIHVPPDVVLNATSAAGAVAFFEATAADALSGAGTPVCAPASGATFPVGLTTVTCTAIDAAGNQGQASFVIRVKNNPPVVVVPDNITRSMTSSTGTPVSFTASASDVEDGALLATCLPVSGFAFPVGSTTVTCRATDSAGAVAAASFVVTIVNSAPVCTAARPSISSIWPPNHQWVPVSILGVTDPDGNTVTTTITEILQDEPTNSRGDGNTAVDGKGVGSNTAYIRAERAGDGDDDDHDHGNGRVYHIRFTATDGASSCAGEVTVGVPHDRRGAAVDDGALYDSTTESLPAGHGHNDGCKDEDHERGRQNHQEGDKCDHELGRNGHRKGDGCDHERRKGR